VGESIQINSDQQEIYRLMPLGYWQSTFLGGLLHAVSYFPLAGVFIGLAFRHYLSRCLSRLPEARKEK